MLSRRTLLTAGGATLALLPSGPGFAHAARPRSFDEAPGADGACALVVHAPELLRGRRAQDAFLGGRLDGYLRAKGLVAFAVDGAPGSARYDERIAAARERVGDRRWGRICWGAAAQPARSVLKDAAAVVLIDQIAALGSRPISGRGLMCHFASRRSADDRRVIDLQLAAVERAGSPLIYHWYDAAPGFAAPRRRRDAAADLVWQRTASFLGRALAQSERDGPAGAANGAAWA